MSIGTGYEYLMRSVVRGDGATAPSTPLTRYYAESGTPPGRWLGSGLAGLDRGVGLAHGSEVTHAQLFRLMGLLSDPVNGDPLGRRPPASPPPLSQRVHARVDVLPNDLTAADHADAVSQIELEERRRTVPRAAAGFDLTFSVPKSVSAVWAVADADTQAAIYMAHRDAIDTVLRWVEAHIAVTRTGAGGAVQQPVRGVIAAAFDHWDSRTGDPHLHTHVVVANRVQTLDGRWQTLDGQVLFRYTVALSEMHEGLLQNLLTEQLGYDWVEHPRRHSGVPRWDIAGVPAELIREFSRRSTAIEAAKNELVDTFVRDHGRQPSDVEVLRLRQQATLATRPDKQQHTLAGQTRTWRDRASSIVGADTSGFVSTLRDRSVLPSLAGRWLDESMLRTTAGSVLDTVGAKRATFGPANVMAEVHRQLHGARFASTNDRLVTAERITDLALEQAVQLTDHPHIGAAKFTTQRILDAETRLLNAARQLDGLTAIAPAASDGARPLGSDQRAAVLAITGSGRALDLLVGPAGTGKTTSLAALRAAWEASHGAGSVIGLAPSAAAAEVLGHELAIDTENTAKWLHETGRNPQRQAAIDDLLERIRTTTSSPTTALGTRLYTELDQRNADLNRWRLQAGQLLIVDEASLAGTLTLDTITEQAADAGAKILLVGDDRQLGAVEAGGAFAMLVRDRTDVPTLTQVRRFRHEWEREASLQLRVGDPAAVDAYLAHDRVRHGNRDEMLDAVHAAWRRDVDDGLVSIMIATDSQTVAELNRRAQSTRLPGEPSATLADDARAHTGDRIVTRDNNRRLHAGRNWVKNGDTWTITDVLADGSVRAARDADQAAVTLPAEYVRDHVELGYATTAHRAQGRTVDTAQAVIDDRTTREALYVAATRGAERNTVYAVDDEQSDWLDRGRQVIDSAIRRSGVDEAATLVGASTEPDRLNQPPELDVTLDRRPRSAIRLDIGLPSPDIGI